MMEGSSGKACAATPNQSDQGPAHWNEVMRLSWQELHGLILYTFRVRQGCVLAPTLFSIATDWIMSICADKAGVNVGQSLFTDTDYADDAVLFIEDDAHSIQLRALWAKTKIHVASGPSPPSCVRNLGN